ncbi:MAG: signal peptidase I [Candidatus Heimdallarchaeota archaeon]|nr:MAG: signal peptidase I [Candidatus Heimdallarchaeota archaeon]
MPLLPLNPKYKTIIELALLLGFAVLIAIAVSAGITFFLGGSRHPTVAVTTGSMLPIYNGFQDNMNTEIYPFRGDILLVKKVPIESVKVGDVIVFNTTNDDGEPPIVHRVVATWEDKGEYFFKTNGDNNLQPDSWKTTGNDVIGVVVFRIPHIGWFLLVVQTTFGKIIILALAVLILFVGDESEEETITNKNKQNFPHQEKNTSLLSKIKVIGTKIIQKKSYIYAVLVLMIIVSFLGSNLLSSFLYPPSVKLYRTEDESRVANLIVSPSPLFTPYHWEDYTNKTTFFFHIQIEIQSGGIFNNVDRIEIRVNETKGLYRWTTVYNFIGTRVFKGAIIAVMDRNTITSALVSVTLYSRGLLASSPHSYYFSIILRSQG